MKRYNTPLIYRVVLLYIVAFLGFALAQPSAQPVTPPPVRASKVATQQEGLHVYEGSPRRVVMPSILDLGVRAGVYDRTHDSWTLDDVHVFYATSTAKPNNQTGFTLLYGHNTEAVLGTTRSLAVGDTLQLFTENNLLLTYVYSGDSEVGPNDFSVVEQKSDQPRLALLTCSGSWSEKRRLMYFDLQSAKEAV